MQDTLTTLVAVSVVANIFISFPVLFEFHIEYPHGPHGAGEFVFNYGTCKRHLGFVLGLTGFPLCIFLHK